MTVRGLEQLVAMQRAARGAPAMITVVPQDAGWLPADAPLPPGFVQPRVGELFPSEAKVADEISKLDRDYNCFNITVTTNPHATSNQQEVGFRQGWDQALAAWKKFVRDNPATGLRGLGVYFTGTGNLIRSINDYRNTLVAWDKAFRERYPAAVATCPAPASPGPVPGLFGVPSTSPGGEPAGPTLPWWATSALTVAVIGGVAYLGYATYKYVTEGAKDVEYVRREVVPRALRLPARKDREAERDPDEGRDRDRYRWRDDDLDPSPHLPYPT